MASLQFKAYLSYSHKDEAWAVWLHRALETYRVPRNLVGAKTSAGIVPSRIRPVFRDREDLSSAADLAESVKQSLAESENLIVICSPEAGASHWVNEEIREFARLGRSNRIFCIIVDGDPADKSSLSTCFPPALAEIGVIEPLAADTRKWADGKRVAKLKLIAGMLGLRLDELRQRDMQRRRKQQLLISLGVAAAVALTLMTVFSRISQKHEQEKAEQLASFVVDLGERLQSDSDLETLALISTEATKNLQSLDQDKLSPETGRKVALAVRQMGQVNQFRDKPQEALQAFIKSRDLLLNLQKKYPEDPQILYELGNAEFFIGNLYFKQGGMDKAINHMRNYFGLTQQLVATDPENPDWLIELSYAHNNLAALQIDSGKGIDDATLAHVDEATNLMEKVVALKPDDDEVIGGYAMVLAWAADAQLLACNIDEASKMRDQARMLAEQSSSQNPANNNLKQNLAFAMTGIARIQTMTGEYDLAKQNLSNSISILQLLADTDPSNIIAKQVVVARRVMLAKLLVDLDDLGAAVQILEQISAAFEPLDELPSRDSEFQRDYIDYLIVSANVDFQMQASEVANFKLQTAMQHQQDLLGEGHRDLADKYRQANARYVWWKINGTANTDYQSSLLVNDLPDANGFQSCDDADAAMRMAVVENDMIKVNREAAYLLSKGYAAPDFVKICRQQNLCPAPDL
jgi:tetratricopeptide (TPR) repeat protein